MCIVGCVSSNTFCVLTFTFVFSENLPVEPAVKEKILFNVIPSVFYCTKMQHPEKKSRIEKFQKHPPHLKGKQIGLYYSNLNKQKRNNGEGRSSKDYFLKCVGSIILSDSRKTSINRLLSSFDKSNVLCDETLQESLFKRKFVATVSSNISDSIRDANDLGNERLDNQFYKEYCSKFDDGDYKRMQKIREKLPAYNLRDDIVAAVNNNQVIVITGETGCGKTTQVAQFLLDDFLKNKKGSLCHICCTQPRRISAYSVAARVAAERCEQLGYSVGYQIRLENLTPRERGSIVFCTTGVLIKQLEEDPSLQNISHLILDEIHERDATSDFLITYISRILNKRKNLKIILMSATLNSDKFSKYFHNCHTIHIPGYTFPVQEYYLEDVLAKVPFQFNNPPRKNDDFKFMQFISPYISQLQKESKHSKSLCRELMKPASEELNLQLIMSLISHICTTSEPQETILVFLTGYGEISKLHNMMRDNNFKENLFNIYPLHSRLVSADQRLVFEKPPRGVRKIILSTNIAETSITIDDVVYVIDCGKIKMTNLHLDTNNESLDVEWVSLANAHQRRGRAGRTQSGVCYHLLTKHRLKNLQKYQTPEILRKRLESIILSVKILKLGDAKSFLNSFMDSPCEKAIDNALNLLKRLEALDEDENLTPLGYHLARLPINPQLGKMILLAASFSCLDPILTIAATLDFKDLFYCPLGKEKLVDKKKFEFSKGWKSDHLLMIEVMKQFERFGSKRFCYENFLSYQTLELLTKMKQQFAEYLYEMNFIKTRDIKSLDSNCNSENFSLVKAIVCAGLYPNVAIKHKAKKGKYPNNILKTIDNETIYLHPQTVLMNHCYFESHLFVYFKRLKCGKDYVFDASMIHPLPLVFFGDKFTIIKESHKLNFISINGRMKFRCSESTSSIIKELRDKLNLFLKYKVSHPGYVNWNEDNDERNILKSIMDLITVEDLDDYDLDDYDDA